MRILKLSAVCAGVVLLLTSAVGINCRHFDNNKSMKPDTGKGFAVLELFTSEGCSSCPPADELMQRIQNESAGKPVYILIYHVDYWNRLGWKDLFSNRDFSKRQYWYNSKFTSQVYTPQLILNGTTEFIGSNEREIRNALASASNGKAGTTLTLHARQQAHRLNIQYQLKGKPVQGQLLLALVQKHAVSRVKAGENKGRTLSHVQIVRQISTFSITQPSGNENLNLPLGFDGQNWEIVGFIQNGDTGEITAAAKTRSE